MKKLIGTLIMLLFSIYSFSHCEIPCGIYDDMMRVNLLKEHITTVEKSMKQIIELSNAKEINDNQMVRWVNNKEEHATKIQEIATHYFLFQRIKIGNSNTTVLLEAIHQICVYAMKAKQTTDLQFIEHLRKTIGNFEKLYFEDKEH